MNSLDWIFIVQAIYITLFTFLYILELVVIWQKRNRHLFKTTFYTLFTLGAVLDLSFELLGSIIHRLPLSSTTSPLFENAKASWWFTAIYGVAYFMPAAQEYLNVAIALNRSTAIVLSRQHERLWVSLSPLCIAIVLLAPFASVWYLFVCPTSFIPMPFEGGIVYLAVADTSAYPDISVNLRTAILIIGGAVLCFLLYSSTAIVMKCSKSRNLLSSKARPSLMNVDRRLFYFGCSLLIFNLPCATLQLVLFFSGNTLDHLFFAYKCLPWLIDVKSFLPPLLLFIFNSQIRRRCLSLVSLPSSSSQVEVPPLPSASFALLERTSPLPRLSLPRPPTSPLQGAPASVPIQTITNARVSSITDHI